ncbi:MAG: carbamoyl-phosphate synthase large subunit [Desulfobacteraceae bacterium]|jgi:carbamoyl-phosphate synthase large subunit
MPANKEMKVLIIGSGPTTIGCTGECLEGAIEACRVLKDLGFSLITVDANPDAVFNASPWSQRPLVEPLTPETISDLIAKERPNALLTLFSGRDGLHLVSELYQHNILSELQVELWGPSNECIESVRDRDTLQSALAPIGLKTPSIFPVDGVEAAIEKARQLGFPVVLRCDDAHLIPDGLLIYNQDELNHIGATLAGEPASKFSVEASLVEWQQIELEVLRDKTGHSILAGGIEYLDTAVVHPGDAIGVSPMQTLPERLQSLLFKQAQDTAEHLEIIGNATLRFAYHPKNHESLILAVHPRYTTSSAMVARISGIPIAKISSLLASGLTWNQLPEDLAQAVGTGNASGIVGVKWPKWDFLRFEGTQDRLGPQMQATGHSVGYGVSFNEAFQKASRSTGTGQNSISAEAGKIDHLSLDAIMPRLVTPSSRRAFEIYAALSKGADVKEISRLTHISPWFIEQLKELANLEQRIGLHQNNVPDKTLFSRAKMQGFTNSDLYRIMDLPRQQIESMLAQSSVAKKWSTLPGEGRALRFSTFGAADPLTPTNDDQKVLIVGNGAYGIGNGTECDNGIFQAAQTIRKSGKTPIIINSNLSSPTSGHSSPCTCYCDPLTIEDIFDLIQFENPAGIILQFAGSAAHDLASALSTKDCKLLGPSKEMLLLQQNRLSFKEHMRQLGIPQPAYGNAQSKEEACSTATQLGYPLLINVKDGSAREIIRDEATLEHYLSKNLAGESQPLWMEQLLEYAIEAQSEVLCDGQNACTIAVLEHIELAGVHAGDSAAVLPPYSIPPRHMETITEYNLKIAKSLRVKGLINIRYGIYRDTVYLLDACCHVSRNLATISTALNRPVSVWATRLCLGESLSQLDVGDLRPAQTAVRAPVFPFNVFSKVDPLLGPNMRAVGQVMALSETSGMAYFKALEATGTPLPIQGTVLITVTDEDKPSILEPARIFSELGFKIMATRGTHNALADNGIESIQVRKLGFGRPNLVDEIKNGHVQMVVNTPTGGQGQIDDSEIRKAAIGYRIINITTPASALAAAKGIAAAIEQKSRSISS